MTSAFENKCHGKTLLKAGSGKKRDQVLKPRDTIEDPAVLSFQPEMCFFYFFEIKWNGVKEGWQGLESRVG